MASTPVISAALMIAGHVEVAVGAARRPDADGLVGEAHVQRVLVRLGVDGDRLDAELAAREDDPQGDFATVGDQDLLKHNTRFARTSQANAQTSARRTAPACPFST